MWRIVLLTSLASTLEDPKEARSGGGPSGWRNSIVLATIVAVSWGIYWLIQKDRHRQRQMKSFMQDANTQLSYSIPQSVIQSHLRLRHELFNKYIVEPHSSIQEADAATLATQDYASSWQRSLPLEAKQELKAAILKRMIATLSQFQAIKRQFEAKAILFERRLIADVHFEAVRDEYQDICAQLEFIVNDANCVEEKFGREELFPMAESIRHREVMRKNEELERRRVAIEKQKASQKQEVAKKIEKEKEARRQKRAVEQLEALLGQEGNSSEKRTSKR